MRTMTYKGQKGSIEFDGVNGLHRGEATIGHDVITYGSESSMGLERAFHNAVDAYFVKRDADVQERLRKK